MKLITFIVCCMASLLITRQAPTAAIIRQPPLPIDTTLAHRITQKMQDSLQLTEDQRRKAFTINCWMDSSKVAFFNLYQGQDTLAILMEGLERTRDSLCHRLLTDAQFVQYGMRKSVLVLNN